VTRGVFAGKPDDWLTVLVRERAQPRGVQIHKASGMIRHERIPARVGMWLYLANAQIASTRLTGRRKGGRQGAVLLEVRTRRSSIPALPLAPVWRPSGREIRYVFGGGDLSAARRRS
jgi:hypothetical protein